MNCLPDFAARSHFPLPVQTGSRAASFPPKLAALFSMLIEGKKKLLQLPEPGPEAFAVGDIALGALEQFGR